MTERDFIDLFRFRAGRDDTEPADWTTLGLASWRQELAARCQQQLATHTPCVLCITGKAGSGKSTLGRQLRKYGLPGIPAKQILVIDDSMTHLKWFGLFPRRIKHRATQRDYLEPFTPYFSGRQLLIYVNTHPEKRIERCDILLRLRCDEADRESRLLARDPDGKSRYESTRESDDAPRIRALARLHLDSQDIDFRVRAG